MIEIFIENMTVADYLEDKNGEDEERVREILKEQAKDAGIEVNSLQIVQEATAVKGGVLYRAYLKEEYAKLDLENKGKVSFN